MVKPTQIVTANQEDSVDETDRRLHPEQLADEVDARNSDSHSDSFERKLDRLACNLK